MAEMGAIIPHEDLVRGCETDTVDSGLVRSVPPRSEDNDANRDERILHGGSL